MTIAMKKTTRPDPTPTKLGPDALRHVAGGAPDDDPLLRKRPGRVKYG